MNLIVKSMAHAPAASWPGGSIRQLAIHPPEEAYEDKGFLWYVSSASVERETSLFTPMPLHNRWILSLDHPITLIHPHAAPVALAPLEPYFFDGAAPTQCRGRVQDFNLILKKNACAGDLQGMVMAPGETAEIAPRPGAGFARYTVLVFCSRGRCQMAAPPSHEAVLGEGQYCLFDGGLTVANQRPKPASLAVCQIYY